MVLPRARRARFPRARPGLSLCRYRTERRIGGGVGREAMNFNGNLLRRVVASLVLALGVAFANGASAQTVNFHIGFTGQVDCQSPIALSNVPISADGTGQINADGTGYADLTQ